MRGGELGLDGGARGRVALSDPGVPHGVHLGESLDVGQPDGGGQNLGLVGSRLGERAIDDFQNFLGLFADAFSGGFIGHGAGQIHGVAVNDSLRHAGTDADAMYAHSFDLLWVGGRNRARTRQAGAIPETAPRKSRLPISTPL